MARATGTVRKIVNKSAADNNGKASAFGFIKSEQGEDLFFLPSHLEESQSMTWEDVVAACAAGQVQRVEFTPVDHPKGRRAIDVRVL